MGLASIVFAGLLTIGASDPLYYGLVDVARLAKQCGKHNVYEAVHHRCELNSPDIKLDYFDGSGDVGPSDHKIGEGDMISLNTPKEAIELRIYKDRVDIEIERHGIDVHSRWIIYDNSSEAPRNIIEHLLDHIQTIREHTSCNTDNS